VIRALVARHRAAVGLRVWCWEDLWRAVREGQSEGPALLPAAAARAALGEAITRARSDGALATLGDVVHWPGFRRRLRARVAAWTRAEKPVTTPPPDDRPATADEWAIFGRYRALLAALGAVDAAGFAAWASRVLHERPPAALKHFERVMVLDLADAPRPFWRALEFFHRRAGTVDVTLPFDSDPALEEVYSPVAPIRDRLREWGFTETVSEHGHELYGPSGPRAVERELFRDDAHRRPPIEATKGLRVLGAPKGDGLGLVVAREVKHLLDGGCDPEDVLVLFPEWDGDSEVVLETLRAWGLPTAASPNRALAAEPGVSALRLAMTVPLDGWETARLVRLLRNGQVRPPWRDDEGPDALAFAASAVQATRVFRGVEPLRRALARAAASREGRKGAIALTGRDTVDRVIALIEPVDRARPWARQVDELRRLAGELGIGSAGEEGLGHLWLALDEHGAVLEGLGRGDRAWTWADFARGVESLVGELEVPGAAAPPGSVQLAAVDNVDGARAEHILLVNLTEGTFPSRESVDPDVLLDAGEGVAPFNAAFAREMLRFLRVAGSADTSLTLIYPTVDEKGQELLRSGFLDDLLRRLAPDAERALHESHRRFDPALLDRADLAGSPADARVRAVALACVRGETDELERLARDPAHSRVLEGTAAALRVGAARFEAKKFGKYDGLLSDPRALETIRERFGPGYVFSPSQLESFISCPFQFALRYVLKLEPVDDRDELEEDYTERGSRIHRVLEELERLRLQDPRDRLELAEAVIHKELGAERVPDSEADAGLHEIERRRLGQLVRRYVKQYEAYERLAGPGRAEPHRFEVIFGLQEEDPASYGFLEIGRGEGAVLLQGKVDRIDLVRHPGGTGFRVIDYKTGSCPSKKDVRSAAYVQLPLYALAVERLVLKAEGFGLHDVGYWGLKKDGFKPIPLAAWEEDRAALEAYVVAVVNQLRRGVFVVDSRQEDCTDYCDYRTVCRVRQVRNAGKTRADVATLELKG
jgi:hypothetical protein